MSDELALLAAIGELPDEDTPRLAYADWLDEHGTSEADRARAEFIRGQIELTTFTGRGMRSQDRYKQLKDRTTQLAKEYGRDWLAGFPIEKVTDDTFTRGFLSTLKIDAQDCLRLPRPPWEREPLASVDLNGELAAVRRLCERGWLAGVAEIDLEPATQAESDDLTKVVLDSPGGTTLRQLWFWGDRFTDKSLLAVANTPFTRLQKLSCMGHFTPEGWRAVLDSPAVDRVTELTIGHRTPWELRDATRPGHTLAEVLTATSRLGGLRQLWLNGCGLTDVGVMRFASRARFPKLTQLKIDNDSIEEPGITAICNGHFPALKDLTLYSSKLTDVEVRKLAQSQLLNRLESLDLSMNQITHAGAAALASCGRTKRLKFLTLGFNSIGDEGVFALANSPNFPALEQLYLSSVNATDAGADAVAAAPWAMQLHTLFMSFNNITKGKQAKMTAKFGEVLWIDGKIDEED